MRKENETQGFFGVFENERGLRRWTYFSGEDVYQQHLTELQGEKPLARDLSAEDAQAMASETPTLALLNNALTNSIKNGRVDKESLEMEVVPLITVRWKDFRTEE